MRESSAKKPWLYISFVDSDMGTGPKGFLSKCRRTSMPSGEIDFVEGIRLVLLSAMRMEVVCFKVRFIKICDWMFGTGSFSKGVTKIIDVRVFLQCAANLSKLCV